MSCARGRNRYEIFGENAVDRQSDLGQTLRVFTWMDEYECIHAGDKMNSNNLPARAGCWTSPQ